MSKQSQQPSIFEMPAAHLARGLGITVLSEDVGKLVEALQNAYRTGFKDALDSLPENQTPGPV